MNDSLKGRDWDQYWRELFPKLTKADYENFAAKYRGTHSTPTLNTPLTYLLIGSDEERSDICRAYTEAKGDMGKIIDLVYCATYEDEDRLRDIINAAIASGDLKPFKRFTSEGTATKNRRQKAAAKEAEEAEEMLLDIRKAEQCAYGVHIYSLLTFT